MSILVSLGNMNKMVYVYNLPYLIRKALCQVLDSNGKWEDLGAHMKFDYNYIRDLRRKESPTDILLGDWGNKNHTVNELFVLLSRMQHYHAMTLLKDYVEERLLELLPEGEELLGDMAYHPSPDQPQAQEAARALLETAQPQEVARATLRPTGVLSPPQTCDDNKDLGFDNCNLNIESPTMKVVEKSVHEVKIQNVQVNGKNGASPNVQNGGVNGVDVAAANQNLLIPQSQNRRGSERRLSTSSVASSIADACMPQIECEELEVATNHWDPTWVLGRGGFGVVYKGTWKNTLVAIKKLEVQMQNQDVAASQLQSELKSLTGYRHDNILSLYGYSVHDNIACLVYQYMANGSLEDRLLCRQNTPPLNWSQRLNIMRGTARGIQYLHSLGSSSLVHGDIKSANILLDRSFEPRLGDFGLAKQLPEQQTTSVLSKVHGTRPYLPREFLRNRQFSVKVDTFSFGVVLFEVATGLRPYDDKRSKKYLYEHIESLEKVGTALHSLADRHAGLDLCASAVGLLRLGLGCVHNDRHKRPDMLSVYDDVRKLYDNYHSALKTIDEVRNQRLTPTSPLELQAVFDMQPQPTRNTLMPSPGQLLRIPNHQDPSLSPSLPSPNQHMLMPSPSPLLPPNQLVPSSIPCLNSPNSQVPSLSQRQSHQLHLHIPVPIEQEQGNSPNSQVPSLSQRQSHQLHLHIPVPIEQEQPEEVSNPFEPYVIPLVTLLEQEESVDQQSSHLASVGRNTHKSTKSQFSEASRKGYLNRTEGIPLVPELQKLNLSRSAISITTSDA